MNNLDQLEQSASSWRCFYNWIWTGRFFQILPKWAKSIHKRWA